MRTRRSLPEPAASGNGGRLAQKHNAGQAHRQLLKPVIEVPVIALVLYEVASIGNCRAITAKGARDTRKAHAECHMREIDRNMPGSRLNRTPTLRRLQGFSLQAERIGCQSSGQRGEVFVFS